MRAVGVEMAADFSHLRLLLSAPQSDRGDVVYARVATPMLRTAAPELRFLARGGYRVQLLLDSISSAVTSCARQLGDTNTAFGDKLTAFSTLLRDHGSEATASEELMSLLITGVARCAPRRDVALLACASDAPARAPQRGHKPVPVNDARHWRSEAAGQGSRHRIRDGARLTDGPAPAGHRVPSVAHE